MVFGFFAVYASKNRQEEFKKIRKHPKGLYAKQGTTLGIPLGLSIGVAMGMLPLVRRGNENTRTISVH